MSDPFDDDEAEDCGCADRVPADLAEDDFWVCPKCDAVWYPEERPQ